MRNRPKRPGEDLILFLLVALVGLQLYFVLTGGPQLVIPLARQEDSVALQGMEPPPQNQPPPPPGGAAPGQPAIPGQPAPPGGRDPLAGAPVLGGIPVSFGENAPEARRGAGNGTPSIPDPASPVPPLPVQVSPVQASPAAPPPGQPAGPPSPGQPVAPPAPGRPIPPSPVQVSSSPVRIAPAPGQPTAPKAPGQVAGGSAPAGNAPPSGQGGADAYRQMLLAVYHLEKQGGKYALTPAQARHFLALVKQMEGVKEAVPQTRKLLLQALTAEQLEYIRAQRSLADAKGQKFAPDALDRYAEDALKRLGGGGS